VKAEMSIISQKGKKPDIWQPLQMLMPLNKMWQLEIVVGKIISAAISVGVVVSAFLTADKP
jgi:hypothetical protein